MRLEFRWLRPPSCPQGLLLFLLKKGDCRNLATNVSCSQKIAGDGAFSPGMIAEHMDSLVANGAGFYRNLFWEAGLVGHVLCLEAEEAGIRATGTAATSMIWFTRCSASHRAIGRASTISLWVAQGKTDD